MPLRCCFNDKNPENLTSSLLRLNKKKVSTPNTDKYMNIKTKRIPTGPIVAGVVVCQRKNSAHIDTIEPKAMILPNILTTLYH